MSSPTLSVSFQFSAIVFRVDFRFPPRYTQTAKGENGVLSYRYYNAEEVLAIKQYEPGIIHRVRIILAWCGTSERRKNRRDRTETDEKERNDPENTKTPSRKGERGEMLLV